MSSFRARGALLALLTFALPTQATSQGVVEGSVRVRGVRDSRDVVVSLDKSPGARVAAGAPLTVSLDQKNLVFVPHVMPVLVGTRVAFPNSDEIRHNVFSPKASPKLDLGTYTKGTAKYYTFNTPGVFTLLCNIHAEMSAYVVVVDTPWFSVTDEAGRFTLTGVPAGQYTLRTWHEKARSSTLAVDVKNGETATVSLEVRR